MMLVARWFHVVVLAVLVVPVVGAQGPAKPGPEHDLFKKREGTWDTTMKAGGGEHKGTVTFKMELGGLWLVGAMDTDLGGMRYYGKSLDTYDAEKKKYIGMWFDSMSTKPMTMEGTYDAEKKTLTLLGDGMGMDGKPAKWKSVSSMPDADTLELNMYIGEVKEPAFIVIYKRKK